MQLGAHREYRSYEEAKISKNNMYHKIELKMISCIKKIMWVNLQEGCNLNKIIMCKLKTWLLEVVQMKWVIHNSAAMGQFNKLTSNSDY